MSVKLPILIYSVQKVAGQFYSSQDHTFIIPTAFLKCTPKRRLVIWKMVQFNRSFPALLHLTKKSQNVSHLKNHFPENYEEPIRHCSQLNYVDY